MVANRSSRRAVLSGAGVAAGALVAGCLGDDEDGGEESDDPVVDVAETTVGVTDPEPWDAVEEIRFDGYVGGWVGVEPDLVDRVENPTLVLFAGREYELSWVNRDGVHHNVALWDDDETIVDDYSTDGTETVGEGETLAFTATPEMATYRCEYQQARQGGDVVIVDDA